MREILKLTGDWGFAFDPADQGLENLWFREALPESRKVRIPHTPNVEPGTEDYRGVMWYSYRFRADEKWQGKRVVLKSGGIYRDADFWLNGIHIGSHMYSGFTPFTIDCSDTVMAGYENYLVIRVDNSFSDMALPIGKSFDWADDGGLFRPVTITVTEPGAIEYVHIDAKPQIQNYGERARWADVQLSMVVQSYPTADTLGAALRYTIYDQDTPIYRSGKYSMIEKPEPVLLKHMELWHFDNPKLYRIVYTVEKQNKLYDQYEMHFGCREFITKDHQFVLNGEAVRLVGTEWMPGSNPRYGNAEPVEYLEKVLQQLKNSNCVFTRFHWQQDDAVYDWCDRHGMLVQEEIPNWGGQEQSAWQIMVSRQQSEEMVKFHGHHPSIIAWGIGNELRGQEEQTKNCLKEIRDYVKMLDPDRMVNYVSNSMWYGAETDAAAIGDSLWVNEYIGTWVPDREPFEELQKAIQAHPGRAFVIAEFGLCEPVFPGGDEGRIQNFLDRMSLYRELPEIAGVIHFSLNDYRTQMGEEGTGAYRRRVHGSTDISGNPKPSYAVVQREYSPLIVVEDTDSLHITCRKDLPYYTVIGYTITIGGKPYALRVLHPGEKIRIKWNGEAWRITRPTGDLVIESEDYK